VLHKDTIEWTSPLSTIAVTAPHGVSQDEENSDPHLASLSERRRVFGENVLPQRATKSLLALMWLALKDKVLVRIILHRFSAIFIFFISRSCCLPQRFALWRSDSFEIPNASPCWQPACRLGRRRWTALIFASGKVVVSTGAKTMMTRDWCHASTHALCRS